LHLLLFQATLPVFSAMIDIHTLSAATQRYMLALQPLAAVLVAASIFSVDLLLVPIFGLKFTEASPVFTIMAFSAGTLVGGAISASALLAAGLQRVHLIAIIVAVSVNFAACAILLPIYGAWGAAFACFLCELALATALGLGVQRALHVRIGEWFCRQVPFVAAISLFQIPHLLAGALMGYACMLFAMDVYLGRHPFLLKRWGRCVSRSSST